MRIVAGIGLVLDMCGGYGDTTFALFRGLVDCPVLKKRRILLFCLSFGYGCCESSLLKSMKADSNVQL